MFTYDIEGKRYTQKKLVLGQWADLSALLNGTRLYSTDALGIMAALGENLPRALAIVLLPEGVHPADKDLRQLTRDLYGVDSELSLQVIDDFFTCNPLPSLLDRLTGIIGKLQRTGSNNLPASSVTETSPAAGISSGA